MTRNINYRLDGARLAQCIAAQDRRIEELAAAVISANAVYRLAETELMRAAMVAYASMDRDEGERLKRCLGVLAPAVRLGEIYSEEISFRPAYEHAELARRTTMFQRADGSRR